MSLIELAKSSALTPALFAEKMAQCAGELDRTDDAGKTALHRLCQNSLSTKDMLCELAAVSRGGGGVSEGHRGYQSRDPAILVQPHP